MTSVEPTRRLADIAEHPLFRVLAYYVFLFASVAALVRLVPGALVFINAPLPASAFLPGPGGGAPATIMSGSLDPATTLLAAAVALASACLLMLPVTWVYAQTRRKKGYQQSVVQTLIILPLVVAGVILLVQNSTALAFSLGGIVGAVSFRNTLRDTKDTIYIFLAIVVGLAAGVHALLVGAAISVGFNLLAVIMWWTDFGRVGATLEGAPAERRLRRAKALANRTRGFISMVDRELLRSMTPEQLDVLANRARMRQQSAAAAAGIGEEPKERRDRTLYIEVSGPPDAGRRAIEGALTTVAKRWEFVRSSTGDGGLEVLEYRVRLKKSADPAEFVGRVRAAAGAFVHKADMSE